MYNQTDLRAAAARLLYGDNRDTADYDMIVKFIDDCFQPVLTLHMADASSEKLLKELREARPIIMANNDAPSIVCVQNNWIPVTEQLPEEVPEEGCDKNPHTASALVLVAVLDDCDRRFVSDDITFDGKWVNYPFPEFEVTHWMPLPEPPKDVTDINVGNKKEG